MTILSLHAVKSVFNIYLRKLLLKGLWTPPDFKKSHTIKKSFVVMNIGIKKQSWAPEGTLTIVSKRFSFLKF